MEVCVTARLGNAALDGSRVQARGLSPLAAMERRSLRIGKHVWWRRALCDLPPMRLSCVRGNVKWNNGTRPTRTQTNDQPSVLACWQSVQA